MYIGTVLRCTFLTHGIGTDLKLTNPLCYWQGFGESLTEWKGIYQNPTKLQMHLPFYSAISLLEISLQDSHQQTLTSIFL